MKTIRIEVEKDAGEFLEKYQEEKGLESTEEAATSIFLVGVGRIKALSGYARKVEQAKRALAGEIQTKPSFEDRKSLFPALVKAKEKPTPPKPKGGKKAPKAPKVAKPPKAPKMVKAPKAPKPVKAPKAPKAPKAAKPAVTLVAPRIPVQPQAAPAPAPAPAPASTPVVSPVEGLLTDAEIVGKVRQEMKITGADFKAPDLQRRYKVSLNRATSILALARQPIAV